MTLLYYDPRFLDHDTGNHPERPSRVRQIVARLESTGLMTQCTRPSWEPASRERLEWVHEPGHIDNVEAMAVEPLPNGTRRLWLMTDNNVQPPLRTLLIAVDVPAAKRAGNR